MAVMITPDAEGADIAQVQMRRITLKVNQDATAKDIIWELAQLFPSVSKPAIQ